MAPATALIVVSYGSHALLERNLAATAAGTDALVVVVDSWSDAAERAAVRRVADRHGWELVGTDRNRGFGAAVNAGAEHAVAAGAAVLVVLNPDLEIAPAGVLALAEAARGATLVAPRVVRPDGSDWFTGGSLDLRTGRTRATTQPDDPAWLSGACLAVSADLWRTVGGFDPEYFLYWEDVDLSRRVVAAGGTLRVLREVVAVHDVGGTQRTSGRAKSARYYRYSCRGRLLFAGTHLRGRDVLRWAVGAPGYAREVVLRGGRRQLLRSPAPLLAAALGTVEGVVVAVRRASRREPAPPPGAAPTREPGDPTAPRRLLVAHPSPDLYGSDRQLLETVRGAADAGWLVRVVLPSAGPLVPLLREAGADVAVRDFPVLRKALLHPARLPGLLLATARAVVSLRALVRRSAPDLLLVNTVTIPVWLVAGRLAGARTVCHVHEAESGPRVLAGALAAPLLLAHRVVANSAAARGALTRVLPVLGRRVVVVHNGVPGPAGDPTPARHDDGAPWRLVLVGRLSPRKGTDVALEALALLVGAGLDVRLRLCGTVFDGYEWFERQLRARAALPDLAGRVELLGYVHPTWDLVAEADVVLVPSRVEPFGNTAVEGMLARRPVVASRTQGLAEVVDDGRTGLLVEPGDPQALAAAVHGLLSDARLRERLADAGRAEALARFTAARYRSRIAEELETARRG